jgi:uncharacterized protein (DUF2345 family)
MPEEYRKSANADSPDPGPFLAKVISHLDPSYMGTLEVQLLHEAGNDDAREGQLRTVKYLNPFYGSSHIDYVSSDPDTHDNTQKAYGMWFVPPDVGQIVACIFIGGDTRKGYWFGCVQNEDMNFSLPGFAATQYVVDSSRETSKSKTRVPVGEYNKVIHSEVQSDTTKKLKPEHPSAKKLEKQGLLKDDIRGITTSSARREVPSMVFGISTPGPIDKAGKKGKVGKHEHKIPDAYVSRLGGSSFVMDDGDDKFLRKKHAKDGPPDYAAVEQGETGGIKDILHNELIRLRTRTGHQILLHNSEDLIYIGNARGTAWIELTSDGKMEVYAEDSISFRTKKDFNFYADRDINLEAGRNFNVKVGGEMHTHVLKDQILIVDANQKIHVKANVDKTVDGGYKSSITGASSSTVAGNVTISHSGTFDHTTGERKLTTNGALHIKTSGNNYLTGATNEFKAGGHKFDGKVESNTQFIAPSITQGPAGGGGPASAASAATAPTKPLPLKTHTLADVSKQDDDDVTDKIAIVRRLPTPEPYPHHENLDPVRFRADKTDRDIDGRYEGNTADFQSPAAAWKKYTTKTDTFSKVAPPNQT